MKDELHKKIIEGLSGELDGKLFEDCAVDLLQRTAYPSLTPLRGGSDGGRDGLFIQVGQSEVPLVCTTGEDVKGNLRENLKQYKSKGHQGSNVILATSQRITNQERTKLEEIAKEEGFHLLQVHDRYDFALRLYGDSTWLKRLLGVESKQQALSINPISIRPAFSLTVKGRSDTLRGLAETEGDLLVVGQPGSGKTFVVRDFILSNDGLFVVSSDRNQIMAEVREKKPRYLVIDDAQARPDLIQMLRQIRSDSGAEFVIIATSWLSGRDAVKTQLGIGDKNIFELELLNRNTILEIVKDCGVKWSEELQAQIVTQAEGKPGLAATLCHLALVGDAMKVYIGDALGEFMTSLFQKELGGEAFDLLAIIALGGSTGISLGEAANLLNIGELHAQRLVTELAYGGVIMELPRGTLTVRPVDLRYFLAKQRFFNGPNSADPMPYIPSYPSFQDVVKVMLHAGLRGGQVNKDELFTLIEKTGSAHLFAGFANFGPVEAGKIIELHPEAALEEPRIYLEVVPQAILPLLLDRAVGDDRPLHSHTSHPLRLIEDWVKDVMPGRGQALPRKKALIEALIDWRSRGGDDVTYAHGLAIAFYPYYEYHRTDPGDGNTLHFGNGNLSVEEIKDTLKLWSLCKPTLSSLSKESWRHLIVITDEWIHDRTWDGSSQKTDQAAALHSGAEAMLKDLVEASEELPGVQSRLESQAISLGIKITVKHDRLYDLLYPSRLMRGENWQERMKKAGEKVKELATELVSVPPTEVVSKLNGVQKQADIAQKTDYRYVPQLIEHIAQLTDAPAAWAKVFLEHSTNANLAIPFLQRLEDENPELAKPLLLSAFNNDKQKFAATTVVVHRKKFKQDGLWQQAYPLIPEYPLDIEGSVIRQELPSETVEQLLKHDNDLIALLAADALAFAYKGKIPASVLELWENAVINYKLTGRSTPDYHVTEALKKHPATIMKWMKAKLPEAPKAYLDDFAREAKELLPLVTRPQKIQLIKMLPDSHRAYMLSRKLVGNDPELFSLLLANDAAKQYRLRPLAKQTGESWVKFVEVAINAGYGEDEIYAASMPDSESWSGPKSLDIQQRRMPRFKAGVASENPVIVSIANRCLRSLEEQYNDALKSEKQEGVYGYE